MIIGRRFRGPPNSANGGYACGVAAQLIAGPAEVTLRLPPPLDRALDVERQGEGVRLLTNGQLVAEARPAVVDLVPPAAPSFADASAATERHQRGHGDPFAMCFVCGLERAPGDGLRIFPGPIGDIAAASWIPDASVADESGRVRAEIVWAVLDCPSWFGFQLFHDSGERALLGRLAARIDERPRVGERCICAGWFIAREGRKIYCGSALYAEAGTPLAVAKATWIVLR